MNFKRQLIGPEVPTPQMFDDVVKDRQVGDIEIKGFTPGNPQLQPDAFGVRATPGSRQVFQITNRATWTMPQPTMKIGSQDE